MTKKDIAIKALKTLDIYKPYIDEFKQNDKVCFFENFGGFWINQEPAAYKKMKEIESKYGCTVYAVTHEYTSIGEMFSFLIISAYEEEWDDMIMPLGNNRFYAFAYVWNVSDEDCSEFGDVAIVSFGGGIKRIA